MERMRKTEQAHLPRAFAAFSGSLLAAFFLLASALTPVAALASASYLGVAHAVTDPFGGANANAPIQTDVLRATGELRPSSLHPGEQAQLRLQIYLLPKHHAYLDQFRIKVFSPKGLKVSQPHIGPTVKFFDKITHSFKKGIEGKAKLTAEVELGLSTPLTTQFLHIGLRYQACTSKYCLLPKTIPIDVPVQITAGHGNGENAQGAALLPAAKPIQHGSLFSSLLNPGSIEHHLSSGWSVFFLVFLMGILTSFTPCVYPMIPITLAIIGSRSDQKSSKWRGFSLSLVYVIGLALTYAILGLIAAKTGALFGSFISSPWVSGSIAIIFILMALSMYGFFELQAPRWVRERLGGSGTTGGGYSGALITGAIAGIVASPCVGPVLVGILAYAAKTQNSAASFLLLFVFALGMGMLLIAVGTFGHLLSRLPRSGAWMNGIKFIFGTIMVAAALYYLRPLLPNFVFLGLTGLALVLIASGAGAFSPPNAKIASHLRKGLLLCTFWLGLLMIAVFAMHWYHGPKRIRAKLTQTLPSQPQLKSQWEAFSGSRFKTALKDHRPLVVDFGADWCTACLELESRTYSNPQVQSYLNNHGFQTFKVDATHSSPALNNLVQQFHVLGLPTVLFFGANGEQIPNLTLTGFEGPKAFLTRLENVEKLSASAL